MSSSQLWWAWGHLAECMRLLASFIAPCLGAQLLQVAGLARSARYGQVRDEAGTLQAVWPACLGALGCTANQTAWLLGACTPSPIPPSSHPHVPLSVQRVNPEAVHTLRQVLHDIAVKEGAAGLFKGAMPSILKAAPSAAVTFAVYDMCMYWLTLRDRQAAAAAAAAGGEAPAAAAAAQPAARSPLH